MQSTIKERELRDLIKILLDMSSDKADSIHLHEVDFKKIQASPAAYGLSLTNKKDIVAVRKGRTILVKPVA